MRDRKQAPFRAPFLMAAGLIALLAGCGRSARYVEPETPAGERCVEACELARLQCTEQEQARVRQCNVRYQVALQQCQATRGQGCSLPSACSTPSFGHCGATYDGCFVACGGRIDPPE